MNTGITHGLKPKTRSLIIELPVKRRATGLPRAVKKEDAHKFAEEKRLLFLETSALDTTNVDKAFEWLVTGVYFLC